MEAEKSQVWRIRTQSELDVRSKRWKWITQAIRAEPA